MEKNDFFEKYQDDLQEEESESEVTNAQVLRREIPWDRLCQAKTISDHQAELIKSFDKKPTEEREVLLDDDAVTYAELFLDFTSNIVTQPELQYVLAIIDELLSDNDGERIPCFLQLHEKSAALPYDPFVRLLNRASGDHFIKSRASRILALLLSEGEHPPEEYVKFLAHWCAEQFRSQDTKDVTIAIVALQRFLRRDHHREVFYHEHGLNLLNEVLGKPETKRQLLYQTMYCLWLMAYNKGLVEAFAEVPDLVKNIVEVLRLHDKVKIRRLGLATLRNLTGSALNNEFMITAGMVKVLNYLSQKKWGDEDIDDDIKVLTEVLDENMVVLSSFDTYKEEILSGELAWSPVHRSERFWRENVGRFEDDDFKLLHVLLDLIKNSGNAKVLSIACYDLGEFVRFHPRGRRVLAKLGGKVDIMKLLGHADEEVQKHALLCVQKMMVHNWEYLSRANVEARK